MSDADSILAEWHEQLDSLRPLLERARRKGDRVKVNLYASVEVASPQFTAIPARERVLAYGSNRIA